MGRRRCKSSTLTFPLYLAHVLTFSRTPLVFFFFFLTNKKTDTKTLFFIILPQLSDASFRTKTFIPKRSKAIPIIMTQSTQPSSVFINHTAVWTT